MKKEILIVTLNWKNIGGSQKRAELLKNSLSKNYNIEHLILKSSKKFNILKIRNFLINMKEFLKYRTKLRKYKVVIAFSNLPSIFALFSSSKLITVITGSTYHYKEAKLISKFYWVFILEPLIYLFSEKIVPAAPHLVPFYLKSTYLHSKVNYINGFIDLNKLKRNTDLNQTKEFKIKGFNIDNYICLSSSIISHKGVKEFFEIFLDYKNILGNNYLKLVVIGDGPLLKDCVEFCRKNKLKYQFKSKYINQNIDVLFTGHLINPLQIIKKCQLFVMPSFYEGLSNQLLEVIYTGVPIIASNCPGNKFVYSEIYKEYPDYINSHFLKLMPVIKNKKHKSIWVKELIFFSKTYRNRRYKNSDKLINKFSTQTNSAKWEILLNEILQ